MKFRKMLLAACLAVSFEVHATERCWDIVAFLRNNPANISSREPFCVQGQMFKVTDRDFYCPEDRPRRNVRPSSEDIETFLRNTDLRQIILSPEIVRLDRSELNKSLVFDLVLFDEKAQRSLKIRIERDLTATPSATDFLQGSGALQASCDERTVPVGPSPREAIVFFQGSGASQPPSLEITMPVGPSSSEVMRRQAYEEQLRKEEEERLRKREEARTACLLQDAQQKQRGARVLRVSGAKSRRNLNYN